MLDRSLEPQVYLVAAVGYGNNGIGYRGHLPWNVPDDLAHFRRVTMDQAIVVGHNTYMGLPHLDGRQVFVAPQFLEYEHPIHGKTNTMKQLLDTIQEERGRVLVCGGAKTYERAMPYATHMWLTRIHKVDVICDTFFPTVDWEEWEMLDQLYGEGCTMMHMKRKVKSPG